MQHKYLQKDWKSYILYKLSTFLQQTPILVCHKVCLEDYYFAFIMHLSLSLARGLLISVADFKKLI